MEWKYRYLSETDSTNRWLREHGGGEDVVAWTGYQTAGRGCGTNTWESERDQNLLFSVLCHPQGVPAGRQFLLLEAMAVALKQHLDSCGLGEPLAIKWPNDLYWRDRKLAGTLSECELHGQTIRSCIIGTGVNLNQTTFRSDAPNPVSVAQILGVRQDVEAVLRGIMKCFDAQLEAVGRGEWNELHARYCASLYRRTGWHAYRDNEGEFQAELAGVKPGGTLLLRDREDRVRSYAFKEVAYI